MKNNLVNYEELDKIITQALREDIGSGDITTDNLIPREIVSNGKLVAKADGIIAGLEIAKRVFDLLNAVTSWKQYKSEGEAVKAGEILVDFEGFLNPLLKCERTALNFLQRISGIATETNKYVSIVAEYKTEILDTRKTVPGLRMLDKYAVKCGGGTNHRIGLYDMVMIKDNHIKAAGSITRAVESIKPRLKPSIKIEVETTNIREVKEALAAGVDVIMLDNMTTFEMSEAVKFIDGRVKVEASGNMTTERLVETARAGVDYISVGALTHSVKALDISMLLY